LVVPPGGRAVLRDPAIELREGSRLMAAVSFSKYQLFSDAVDTHKECAAAAQSGTLERTKKENKQTRRTVVSLDIRIVRLSLVWSRYGDSSADSDLSSNSVFLSFNPVPLSLENKKDPSIHNVCTLARAPAGRFEAPRRR
jgi:hypothetical protein